jgi:polycomb protein SCMH1
MSSTEPETTSSSSTSDESKSGSTSSQMNGKSRSSSGKKSPVKQIQSPPCTWCMETKTPLKYVLPTQNGKKEFCSESCIAEFRKSYNKSTCLECDNVVRANAPSQQYCSAFCLNKNKNKRKSVASTSRTSTENKSLNNNNSNLSNNNKKVEANNNHPMKEHYSGSKISPMFQYEAFHVFDWREYLKVGVIQTESKCLHINFLIYFRKLDQCQLHQNALSKQWIHRRTNSKSE